jgi:hypothetical protein
MDSHITGSFASRTERLTTLANRIFTDSSVLFL